MKTMEFAKAVSFILSMLFTLMTIDDMVKNIIKYSKMDYDDFITQKNNGNVPIIPVNTSVIAICTWAVFYTLTLF